METRANGIDPLFPLGFRFYPTEEGLLSFYLCHRLPGTWLDVEHSITVIDIYGYHPPLTQGGGLAEALPRSSQE
jgi:hypothetical protein